jgi:hypothetical protein
MKNRDEDMKIALRARRFYSWSTLSHLMLMLLVTVLIPFGVVLMLDLSAAKDTKICTYNNRMMGGALTIIGFFLLVR